MSDGHHGLGRVSFDKLPGSFEHNHHVNCCDVWWIIPVVSCLQSRLIGNVMVGALDLSRIGL